jgi:CxxC-x17-CxxC domain-containing protein
MNNFNRSNSFDRNRNSGGRRFEKPEMFQTTCSNCGKDCQVPFRPSGDKPVYCSDCFEKQGGNDARRSDSRGSGRNNFKKPQFERRSNFSDRPSFQAVCDKCGKNCDLPFKPTNGRPVFCKNCFDENAASGRPEAVTSPSQVSYQKQFDELNAKMDTILALLKPVEAMAVAEMAIEDAPIEVETAVEAPVEAESVAKAPKKKARKTSTKTKK